MAGSNRCPQCHGLIIGSQACPRCALSRPSERSTGRDVNPSSGSRVSARYRKVCRSCGADVTFRRPKELEPGVFLCSQCATREGEASPANSATAEAAPSPPPAQRISQPHVQPHSYSTAPPLARAASTHVRRERKPLWIGLGVFTTLSAIAWVCWVLFTPTWELKHRSEINRFIESGTALLQQGKYKESHAEFRSLFSFIGDRTLTDRFVQQDVQVARQLMEHAYAKARPIIDRELAEEKAREEQARAAELARQSEARLQELRREQEADRAARESEARAAAERQRIAEEQRMAAARVQLRQSRVAQQLLKQADKTVGNLAGELAGEDSPYRAISRSSDAVLQLMAIFAKLDLMGHSVPHSDAIDAVLSSHSVEMIGEDSAIRATYKRDKATFEVTAAWAEGLARDDPAALAQIANIRRRVVMEMIGDDSAIRGSSSYQEATMNVLAEILGSRGLGTHAALVVRNAGNGNLGENSAWRSSMRFAQAILGLTMCLLEQEDRPVATKLRGRAIVNAFGEDSALLAQAQYKQATVDALHSLIARRCAP